MSNTTVDTFRANDDGLLFSAHAWHICPDDVDPGALRQNSLCWLMPEENAQLGKFLTAALQHQYLLTRALCRGTLSRCADVDPADWRFGKNDSGKPSIDLPVQFRDLHFNLTHTAGLIVCLVTRAGEVGIDAEEITRPVDADQIAGQFFSEAEQTLLARLDGPRTTRFYEQWVLKEAYLKGCGNGFSRSPEEFTISRDHRARPLPLDQWQFTLHYPTPQHVAAVAIRPHRSAGVIPVLWRASAPFLRQKC
jgi:4'-phosphopantetheinyl transferase